MPELNLYTMEQIGPRIRAENIDISASFNFHFEFTIEVRKRPSIDRDDVFGLWLRWARPPEIESAAVRFSPYRARFLYYGELLPLLVQIFDIHEDARVWYSARGSEMNYQDAFMHMLSEREDISFSSDRSVAVAAHPYLGIHDEVLPELGIELQFNPPKPFWERPMEEWTGCGTVDPWFGPAKTGVLTFADLAPAFVIDPKERSWRVGAPGELVNLESRHKYPVCDCGDPDTARIGGLL